MTQWVKALAAKADSVGYITGTHVLEGKATS